MIRAFMTMAVLAACAIALPPGAGADSPPSDPVIGIEHFAFGEKTLTVPAGTTVTWVNHDDEPHTVTSAEKLFTSPGLDAGESFSYRFTTPGTYVYFCALHPHMTARVVVR